MGTPEPDDLELKLKPDHLVLRRHARDKRPLDRIVAHYRLERRLADRLRNSTRVERSALYTALYGELFASLPDHPQNTRGHTAAAVRNVRKTAVLSSYLNRHSVYLEIGCGDGTLAFAVAPNVAECYGLDVTDALVNFAAAPPNFRFLKTSGIEVPLPSNRVDMVHSNQLMEHLHPDDVEDQLREIIRVLKPGGRYFCSTPSRISGPHDVSRYFDDVATGFHMREYDYRSIREIFSRAGFRQLRFPVTLRNRSLGAPPYVVLRALELGLLQLPSRLRRRLIPFSKFLMGINVVATK